MTLAFISHTDCFLHHMGAYHPESPARLRAIKEGLEKAGLTPLMTEYQAPNAQREHLVRVHHASYIDQIFDLSPEMGFVQLDPDVRMNPYSLKSALKAAGAGILAVDLIMNKKAEAAFCNVRPPGHHALPHKAMGFCIFNNIAIAVSHALKAYDLQRVLIFDFDVHQGNGTVEMFEGDERVLYCSTFEHPFYPFSALISEKSNIINMPLAAGSSGKQYRETVEKNCIEAITAFQPEMIFFSAGFDAYINDPLADLQLLPEDYYWVTQRIVEIGQQCCPGRVVSMLEGGYDLEGLSLCVPEHIKALLP